MSKKAFEFKSGSQVTGWMESAKSDRVFIMFLVSWILPVIISLLFSLVFFDSLSNEIPLFYSRIWGIGQLAAKQFIFLPIAGTFLLGCFNFAIAINFYSRDRVLSYFLTGTMSLVSVLSAVTVVNIIRLMS